MTEQEINQIQYFFVNYCYLYNRFCVINPKLANKGNVSETETHLYKRYQEVIGYGSVGIRDFYNIIRKYIYPHTDESKLAFNGKQLNNPWLATTERTNFFWWAMSIEHFNKLVAETTVKKQVRDKIKAQKKKDQISNLIFEEPPYQTMLWPKKSKNSQLAAVGSIIVNLKLSTKEEIENILNNPTKEGFDRLYSKYYDVENPHHTSDYGIKLEELASILNKMKSEKRDNLELTQLVVYRDEHAHYGCTQDRIPTNCILINVDELDDELRPTPIPECRNLKVGPMSTNLDLCANVRSDCTVNENLDGITFMFNAESNRLCVKQYPHIALDKNVAFVFNITKLVFKLYHSQILKFLRDIKSVTDKTASHLTKQLKLNALVNYGEVYTKIRNSVDLKCNSVKTGASTPVKKTIRRCNTEKMKDLVDSVSRNLTVSSVNASEIRSKTIILNNKTAGCANASGIASSPTQNTVGNSGTVSTSYIRQSMENPKMVNNKSSELTHECVYTCETAINEKPIKDIQHDHINHAVPKKRIQNIIKVPIDIEQQNIPNFGDDDCNRTKIESPGKAHQTISTKMRLKTPTTNINVINIPNDYNRSTIDSLGNSITTTSPIQNEQPHPELDPEVTTNITVTNTHNDYNLITTDSLGNSITINKPVENKPIEDKPIEDKLIEAKLIEADPIKANPIEDKPVNDNPIIKLVLKPEQNYTVAPNILSAPGECSSEHLIEDQEVEQLNYVSREDYNLFVAITQKVCNQPRNQVERDAQKINEMLAINIKCEHQSTWDEEDKIIEFLTKYNNQGIRMLTYKGVDKVKYETLRESTMKLYYTKLDLLHKFLNNAKNYDVTGNLRNKDIADRHKIMNCVRDSLAN